MDKEKIEIDIKSLNIIFMGTPQFAVPSLCMLTKENYNVVGVFTQCDKLGNRMKQTQSPIKTFAIQNDLQVFQFEKLKSPQGVQKLKELQPDIVITAAFGQLLTQEILDIPKFGIFNVHASLLPKYRGGCPIHWCIIEGQTQTGITIMRTERGLDTGPIILQFPIQIDACDNYDTMYQKLSDLGAVALQEFLCGFGSWVQQKQDETKASYQPIIKKSDGQIDWTQSAYAIYNMVRGVTSFPGAYTNLCNSVLKVLDTEVVDCVMKGNSGQIVAADTKVGLIVQCGQGHISIKKLQLPGKKCLNATEFLRGNKIVVGTNFDFRL
ncbi:MAG: methionyl-tRNA formyltransferase [Clostridiales bacterium]|jgi:methionyl-tRNA formyltransferase|nr:methionyl-tRNA formyltransferase [Clostridiales bacterium]